MNRLLKTATALLMCVCMLSTSVSASQVTGAASPAVNDVEQGVEDIFLDEVADTLSENTTDVETSEEQMGVQPEGSTPQMTMPEDTITMPEEEEVIPEIIVMEEAEVKLATADEAVDQHVNRYMADSYLNSPGWFNDEAQQYPEGFFGMGALDDQFWWKPMAVFWKKLEATTGSIELDNSKKALYQALVMDMMSSYVQLDKDMKADLDDNGVYNFQTEENKWDFAAAAAESSEAAALLKETVALSGQISEKGELLGKLAKNLHGEDTAEARKIVEETFRDHLMDIYSSDITDIDVLGAIDIGLSYAQTLGDVVNKCDQLSEIVKANENMKYILMDMQDNLDLAFASSYTGTSIEKAYEKQIMNDALQEMIDILEANEAEMLWKYAEETVTDFNEMKAEVAYSFLCEALWEELAATNPEVAAINYGMKGGVFCSDLFFKTNNKVDNAAKYNVLCKMYRVVYGGMQGAKQKYSSSKTDANAQNYVNYMHMYIGMYGMMLDAISQWAEETEIYAKCYANECKRTVFGLLEELPSYETFKQSMKSKWTNLKASANGYVYARYADAMADYAEQMNRKRLSTQQALQDAQAASEDAAYVSNLSAILGEVQTYSAAPAIAVPSEAETEQLKKESQLGQFELQSQTISSDLTLQEDRTTYGDMTFSGGILDLNGHTLTVYGDFNHEGGQIRFNNGTLLILGNYWCREEVISEVDGTLVYLYSSGTLRMEDEKDLMQVAGDFYWDAYYGWTDDVTSTSIQDNMLRAGTIQIGGDFTAVAAWRPSTLEGCTHKEEFVNPNGTKIYFNPSLISNRQGYFNQVEFPEKAEGKDYYPITWSGEMKGLSLQQDTYLILPESEYLEGYHELNITEALDLNGHTLTLEGDIMHTGGQINFNGGKLKLDGNYYAKGFEELDADGDLTYIESYPALRMMDANDRMQVAGDFYWDSHSGWINDVNTPLTYNSMLCAGTIQVGGNFTVDSSWMPSTLEGCTHKEEFVNPNGTEVYFAYNNSRFNEVKFPERAEGKNYYPITWSGEMKGFSLQQDMYLILPESEYLEGYHELNITGALDLNGHTLTLEEGDILHTDGQIKFNGGKLKVTGNYHVNDFSRMGTDGNTYTYSEGTLYMVDKKDLMQVAGDFYWKSGMNWRDDISETETNYNVLRAGTIQIGGNFTADQSWLPSTSEGCTHKEEFVNPNGTEIYFANNKSRFNEVEFPEKEEGKDYYPITWSGYMKGFSLQQDMYLILPEVEYPSGYHELNVYGALDLNGYTLTMEGDILHTDGQIKFNGGKLKVTGNYHVNDFSGPNVVASKGTLCMVDEKDLMQVAGDFYWRSYREWTNEITNTSTTINILRAGTIRVDGNFTTNSSWLPSTLKGGNKNAVYLKGDKCKKITLQSGSKFNILKLDREPDDYTISPASCWEVLYVDGKYYVEPKKNVYIDDTNITHNDDGTVSITKEGDEPVNILITLPQTQEEIVISDSGEVTLPTGAVVTSDVTDKTVTVQSQATVSMNGVITGQSVQIGDITVTAQEDTKVVVDETGNVTIPEGGTVTTQEDVTIALPQGGTMDDEETITGTEVTVAGVTVTAPTGEELTVSTTGTVTAPSGSMVTKQDGTQSQLPQGGTVSAIGEITGTQVPVVDEDDTPTSPELPAQPGQGGSEQPPAQPGQGSGEQTQPSKEQTITTPSEEVNPASIKVGKVKTFKAKKKGKAGKLTLSWKKVSGVSGYEVSYSLNKKFKKAKTINVSAKKTKVVIKKLKVKKTYYMRIRAYKTYKDANGVTKKKYGKYKKIRVKIK